MAAVLEAWALEIKRSLELALPKTYSRTKYVIFLLFLGSKLSVSTATVFGMSGLSIQNGGENVNNRYEHTYFNGLFIIIML